MIGPETPVADAAEKWLYQLAQEKRNEAWSRYQERRERFSVAGALLGAAVGVSLVLAATQEMSAELRLILTVALGGLSSLFGVGFAHDPIGKWLIEKNYFKIG